MIAAVADLLGVGEEACAADVVVLGAEAGRAEGQEHAVSAGQTTPGAAWAAAGRQDSSPGVRSRGGIDMKFENPRRRRGAPDRGGSRRDC